MPRFFTPKYTPVYKNKSNKDKLKKQERKRKNPYFMRIYENDKQRKIKSNYQGSVLHRSSSLSLWILIYKGKIYNYKFLKI